MADRTLIVHWNGSVWKVVASRNVGGVSRENFLTSVVAISAQNIWAVGSHNNGTADRTLIMHWNGSSWKIAASSNRGGPASENILTGVAAVSASEIWAVGKYDDGAAFQTLIGRWNGTSWANVASPDPGAPANNNVLNAATDTSTSNVWPVGYYFKQGGAYRTLTVRWDGASWKIVPSPSPGGRAGESVLTGVAASGACSAWAVGYYDSAAVPAQTLALHWG